MPTYEAECTNCGAEQEFFARMADCNNAPTCVYCAAPTKRIISAVAGIVRFPAAGGHEYTSPASGKRITTERQRRDDLARTGCRPYEGFASESKEAKKRVAEDEKKNDEKLEHNVRKAYHQLSPEKRRHLGG